MKMNTVKKIKLHMHSTLNGIVSRVEDGWATINEEILKDSLEYYNTIDTIIGGKNSYIGLTKYWENAELHSQSEQERIFAKRINQIEKFVLTHDPDLELTWGNAKKLLVTDEESFKRVIEELKKKPGKDISVESGTSTWQSFLRTSLFDELYLFIQPVIRTEGEMLFSSIQANFKLKLLETKVFSDNIILLHYHVN